MFSRVRCLTCVHYVCIVRRVGKSYTQEFPSTLPPPETGALCFDTIYAIIEACVQPAAVADLKTSTAKKLLPRQTKNTPSRRLKLKRRSNPMFLAQKILRDTDPTSWLFNPKYRRRVRRKRRGIKLTVNGQPYEEWYLDQA